MVREFHNCLYCKNRRFSTETIWEEKDVDNIILRLPKYVFKTTCPYQQSYDNFIRLFEINPEEAETQFYPCCNGDKEYREKWDETVKQIKEYYKEFNINDYFSNITI